MKARSLIAVLGMLVVFSACHNDVAVQSPSGELVEGAWHGTLASSPFNLTFVEGEFEGWPTVTGSAYLDTGALSTRYEIMNGTHNRVDRIWFSLYKVPVVSKGEYNLSGDLRGGTIEGTYKEFNHNGDSIGIGTWHLERTP